MTITITMNITNPQILFVALVSLILITKKVKIPQKAIKKIIKWMCPS